MKSKKSVKTETVEEYLARGGEIQHIAALELEEETVVMKPTNSTAQIMTLSDGAHFFAEKQTRKTQTPEEKNKKGKEKLSDTAAKYFNTK